MLSPFCQTWQAFIFSSVKVTSFMCCGESSSVHCSSAPALVSATSPWGAETGLESVAVDSNHCLSLPPDLPLEFALHVLSIWRYQATVQYTLKRTDWYCISFIPLSAHSVFLLLIHSGFFVSLIVILLCLYLSNKTFLSYITHIAHTCTLIYSVSLGDTKLLLCQIKESFQ